MVSRLAIFRHFHIDFRQLIDYSRKNGDKPAFPPRSGWIQEGGVTLDINETTLM